MSTTAASTSREEHRALATLTGGVALGLLLAALAIVQPWASGGPALPPGAAARVNGNVISQDTYRRALGKLASDSKEPLQAAQREFVLERLIDEELLVERGLDLGMAESERPVRAAIIRGMISSINAEVDAKPIGESDLRRFYSENGDFFARSQRVRVTALRLHSQQEAEAARIRVASGAPLRVSVQSHPAPAVSLVPGDLLPLAKLREYLGPSAAQAISSMAVGEVSQPIPQAGGFLVVQLLERKPDELPSFELVRDEAQAAYRRQQADNGLRQYLDRIKRHASIQRNRKLPATQ